MIDPNIWESEDVAKLNFMGRLLLIGMFSNADDYGKGRANPTYLRSTVFKYDDIPINEIESAITTISRYINIIFYEIDGSKYYMFTNWDKWQNVQKPQESKIPDPPELVQNNSGISQESFQNQNGQREEKRKEEEEKGIEVEEEENESAAASSEFAKVIDAFNRNIHPVTPVEAEKIHDWLKDMEPGVIIAAIGEAVTYSKRSMGYINAVLSSWLSLGIKTALAAEAYLRDRANEKNNKNPSPGSKNVKFKAPVNTFNSYDQRSYDIKKLEKQLLGLDESDDEGG
jgi:DnaD/phage-associated family protein